MNIATMKAILEAASDQPETSAAPPMKFDAPASDLVCDDFVPDEGETLALKPRYFSSGNPGWRVDCKGSLHGIPVRLQMNATIPKAALKILRANGILPPEKK